MRKKVSVLDRQRPKPKPGIHEIIRQTLNLEWCPSKGYVKVPIADALFDNKIFTVIIT